MSRKIAGILTIVLMVFLVPQETTSASDLERVIVTTSVEINKNVRSELAQYAVQFHHVFPQVRQIAMTIPAGNRARIASLEFVESIVDDLPVELHQNTVLQNLDLIDVGEAGTTNRVTPYTGAGVLVAFIDSGLMPDAEKFIPGKINRKLSVGLVPQGGLNLVDQPNILRPGAELSQDAHGSVGVSLVLGYDAAAIGIGTRANSAGLPSTIEGVAPNAEVFAVRVFPNIGGAFFSDVAAGLLYAVAVKQATGRPLVVNLSLGASIDPRLFPGGYDNPFFAPLRAPYQFAISQGVIVVASAGNSGSAGMDIPGGFPEIISVGAAGANFHDFPLFSDDPRPAIFGIPNTLSQLDDVSDAPDDETEVADNVYVFNFSSRELPADGLPPTGSQDLDVVAPGGWLVAPWFAFATGTGISRPPVSTPDPFLHQSFAFNFGTSFSAPHVTGVVALLLEKNPGLTQAEVEAILEASAVPIPAPGEDSPFSDIRVLGGAQSWGSDATGAGYVNVLRALSLVP